MGNYMAINVRHHRQPQPTPNREPSSSLEWPRCEGGSAKAQPLLTPSPCVKGTQRYASEAIRHLRPRILLQENVAALVNQQNSADFREWRQTVERLGYRSYWAVLNARDYGILEALGPVPQNRERLFMVSVRQDLCPGAPYPFPNPMPLTRTIADVLDEDVSENFFLKPESVVSFLTRNESGDHCLYRVTDHLPTPEEIRQWVREEGHTLS